VEAGVDAIEHCTGITSGGLALDPALMDRIAAAGIVVCPTVGMDREVLAQIPPPPPSVAAVLDRLGMTMPEMFAARYPVIGGLHRAGVRLLAGVDSGIGLMKPHGFVANAVAVLVECGLSTPEALAAATSSSADALGLGDVTGRLRPSLAADLLVVDGDLETDLGALRHPVRVVLAGRTVSSPTLGP
jgi:imidazolonepropionase-like amidohydrolase